MATGFAPYILKSLKALAGQNYPGTKITAPGFLQLLLENSNIQDAKLTNEAGHQMTAKVKYKQRISPSLVSETDNCDIDFVPAYREADITAVRTAKLGFYISLETVSKYMEEASRATIIGNSGTRTINEIADQIAHTANAVIGKVDQKLLGDVDWGKNVVYSDDAVHNLNLNKDASVNNLDSGYAKLLNDAFENEFYGNLLIAGSGKFNQMELMRMAGAIGANQAGIDVSKFTGYKFYPDLHAKSSVNWGGDDIGVFAPGSIHFVDFDKYKGFRAGKIGNSTFFQITLDVNGTPMTFDAQLRELDCPTQVLDVYGAAGSYDVGYVLYLRKIYGLFQTPSDAFATSDRLTGVNGAIHYNITNDCESCS